MLSEKDIVDVLSSMNTNEKSKRDWILQTGPGGMREFNRALKRQHTISNLQHLKDTAPYLLKPAEYFNVMDMINSSDEELIDLANAIISEKLWPSNS